MKKRKDTTKLKLSFEFPNNGGDDDDRLLAAITIAIVLIFTAASAFLRQLIEAFNG